MPTPEDNTEINEDPTTELGGTELTADDVAAQLTEHCASYYAGTPTIEDAEFDALVDKLRELNPSHAFLQSVGSPPAETHEKVRHFRFMGSLNKASNESDLRAWYNKCIEAAADTDTADTSFIVQAKLDGLSLELQYENGTLQRAVTRGDGEFGEDVTDAARKVPGVKLTIPSKARVAVRGEVLLPFENVKSVAGDDRELTSPRNLAAGVLRRKTDEKDQAKFLTFVAFDWVGDTEIGELEKIQSLVINKFNAVASEVCPSFSAIKETIDRIAAMRPSMKASIDGVVVKVSDRQINQHLGESSGRPKWAIAFKWKSDEAEAELLSVEVTVGHSGVLAPVAVLKPVELMGTKVSRVFLNNWEEIKRFDLHIGDTLLITKRGDIIPKVEAVVKRGDGEAVTEPTTCPCPLRKACGRRENTGGDESANTFCLEDACPNKTFGRIKRWVKGRNILYLGDVMLEAAMEAGLVTGPADLYKMTAEQWASLKAGSGRIGGSRARQIHEQIERSRKCTVRELFGSLGIDFLGIRRVEIMQGLDPRMNALDPWLGSHIVENGKLLGVPGVAEQIQTSVSMARPTIDALAEVLDLSPNALAKASSVDVEIGSNRPDLDNVVITGTLSEPRKDIEAAIEAAGGRTASAVTSNTKFLVCNDPDSSSSKMKKAKSLNIPVISEEDLAGVLAAPLLGSDTATETATETA